MSADAVGGGDGSVPVLVRVLRGGRGSATGTGDGKGIGAGGGIGD